jgi:serralysin
MINFEQITLISEPYYNFTYPILSDGIVKTFIHKTCEPKKFINNMLSYVEDLIDVDFKLVKRRKHAELNFYETPLIADNQEYLGLAVPYESSSGNKWNLYVKSYTGVYSKKWVYLHEFGHFIGMEHPFDDTDGDVWYNESTNDTVMSYNYLPSFRWWFRQADIDTITGMWV